MLVVDQVTEKELLVTKLASMEHGLRNNITNPEGFPGGGGGTPETNSQEKPLQMDGWNTILSYWISAYVQVLTVSFREGNYRLCHAVP